MRTNRSSVAVLLSTALALSPAPAPADISPAPGMATNAANVSLPEARNALQVIRVLTDFGAVCDGVTDDAAAFALAVTWMKPASNRVVHIPAGAACATSTSVIYGDGRQHSTTLSSGLSGGETTIPAISTATVLSGDAIVVVADDGTTFKGTVSGAPSGGNIPIQGTYTGTAAASGNVVYTGHVSSYNGGGFRGYGSCSSTPTGAAVSTIKYIGAAAPATTLGATASAGATSLTVASIAGINIGDPIKVVLDSAVTFWTTVAETPAGTTVKIVNEVPSTATSGNAVLVANNPVARIAGPIIAPVFEGICLDGNGLAGVGLEVVHAVGGNFRGPNGVTAKGYTGIGAFVHTQSALLGINGGSSDNQFELYTILPQNNRTIGMWATGHPGPAGSATRVAMSRNTWFGGRNTMGGADAPAAGIRTEWFDNNTHIKPYTDFNGANVSGAGLYRMPSLGISNFPIENVHIGAAYIGGAVDGTATGGTTGYDTYYGYGTGDSEPLPTGKASGTTTHNPVLFGFTQIQLPAGGSISAPPLRIGGTNTGCYSSADGTNLYCGANGILGTQWGPGGSFGTLGSRLSATDTKTTSGTYTTAGALTDYVGINKTVGAATAVTLTNSSNQNITICDEKGDAATNNITVTPSAGNIDGSASYVIGINYGCATFHRNGTSAIWKLVSTSLDGIAAARLPALTGDTTTAAGSAVTTTSKLNGVAYGTSPATNTVPVITSANTATYQTARAASGNLSTVYALCQSGVQVSHTGDTAEFALATCTIPANAIGANGRLRIEAIWSHTNSANVKTLRVRFSTITGTVYFSVAPTTTATSRHIVDIANRNATNSQVGFNTGAAFGENTIAVVTSAVDTTAQTTIIISGQLTNTGETVAVESYYVELISTAGN